MDDRTGRRHRVRLAAVVLVAVCTAVAQGCASVAEGVTRGLESGPQSLSQREDG
jgi:hypothetical protein